MAKQYSLKKEIIERRRGSRADRVVAVKHRLIKRRGRRQKSVWSLSTTKNMSYSGLLFFSPVEYKAGDHIEVEVVMSGLIDIYNGPAKVIRVREAAAHAFDVAVEYVVTAPEKRPARSHLQKKK